MQDNTASLVEHLTELRKRLIWIVAVLVVAMIGGFFAAKPIIVYLMHSEPASSIITLNTFSPWDAIRLYMQFSFAIGLVVTLPFTLTQLWLFVRPGLLDHEKKATLRYIPGAVLLFLLGLSFAYFVIFPMAFYFTSNVTQSLSLTETYGAAQYFSFMFNILLPMALLFELPVVVMFLTKLRILNPSRLQKLRRYAYLVLVVIATVVTPPDFISDILVAIPMILLYEVSIMLSARIYKKQLEMDKQWMSQTEEA
ncbi:twin-arginine translocase subunit TatC [Paenibacillus ginsengarvi]|uniref:Sec-independent protein translocase protein TatC n=1 Tax=Paenibacillus ginsengarvi TaxID=400777 RepID=A0A3B0CF11_9BACL|nr:twin-arginine translocase subunit TatC [Paenibacillus ginsengarvi]